MSMWKVLAKVIDKHDVAILLVDLGVEEVAPVGRDRQPFVEILVHIENFVDLFAGEIKIAHRPARICRHEIVSSRRGGP